jgi:hypothetical protein
VLFQHNACDFKSFQLKLMYDFQKIWIEFSLEATHTRTSVILTRFMGISHASSDFGIVIVPFFVSIQHAYV